MMEQLIVTVLGLASGCWNLRFIRRIACSAMNPLFVPVIDPVGRIQIQVLLQKSLIITQISVIDAVRIVQIPYKRKERNSGL